MNKDSSEKKENFSIKINKTWRIVLIVVGVLLVLAILGFAFFKLNEYNEQLKQSRSTTLGNVNDTFNDRGVTPADSYNI
jgi:flagellar basal body-associated protein FliL